MDAILVTGDIAYSGKTEEYAYASQWLAKLAAIAGCSEENIVVVPGNHDVDRAVISGSTGIQSLHRDIRSQDGHMMNYRLQSLMNDRLFANTLFLPMAAYNDFAAKYLCALGPDKPYWETSIPMNDGSILRLRGMTSTMVSDASDNDGDNRLVLGHFQATFDPDPSVTYVTLCHHPLPWLKDGDIVKTNLDSSAKIQLYGHRHVQRLNRVDESLVLTAGALHPDRREGDWEPRYNFVQVRVESAARGRVLNVEVFARRWNENLGTFVPDVGAQGNIAHRFELTLPSWSRPDETPEVALSSAEPYTSNVLVSDKLETAVQSSKVHEMRATPSLRKIAYDYFALPYVICIEIADRLHLIDTTDRQMTGTTLLGNVIDRARERQKLPELADEIAKAKRS